MTQLASVPQNTYSPLTRTFPFSVSAGATRIQVTLTHPNTLAAWPAGPLYQFDWDWGSGNTGSTNSGSGGIRNGKDGLPIAGNVSTSFNAPKPAGVTSGSLTVTSLQTLTTAILVESF